MTRITFSETSGIKSKYGFPSHIEVDYQFPGFEYESDLEAISPSLFSFYTGINPRVVARMIRTGEVPSIAISGQKFIVRPPFEIVFTERPATPTSTVVTEPCTMPGKDVG
jgi:hypothetical protein